MATYVSPGVYTKIVDLSEYVRNVPSTIGFIPIISERGPDNQLIFTNSRDFYLDFGEPNINYVGRDWGSGPYVASSFLTQSDSLYVVRVLPDDAYFANMFLVVEDTGSLGLDSTADVTISYKGDLDDIAAINAVVGTSDDSTSYALAFYGIGRGAFYNDFKITLEQSHNEFDRDEKHVYYWNLWQKQSTREGGVGGAYEYQVIESLEVSLDPDALDNGGSSLWLEDLINNNSRYVRCIASKEVCRTAVSNSADFSQPFYAWDSEAEWSATGGDAGTGGYIGGLVLTAQPLEDGDDGELFNPDLNNNVDPTVAEELIVRCYNGTLHSQEDQDNYVDEIADKEKIYYSLVFDGGYQTKNVKTAILNLCIRRGDCVGIIDNGDNSTPQAAINRRNSSTTGDYTYGINNKAVAIYEGYSKVYDQFTNSYIWMSPCYHMARVIPYSDNVTDIWFAPAGFNRAVIAGIASLRYSPNLADRDRFYLLQLNPIVRFSDVGDVVFGQLTSQARPTALQNLPVIRTVLYIQRALEQFVKYYIFEQNDADTWGAISTQVNYFLNVMKTKRALSSFSVEVGSTEYEIKAKIVHINVTLVPVTAIEQIHLTFFIK